MLVIPTGFEPVTTRLGIWCSILLSYEIFILYIHRNLGYTNLLLCLECDFLKGFLIQRSKDNFFLGTIFLFASKIICGVDLLNVKYEHITNSIALRNIYFLLTFDFLKEFLNDTQINSDYRN